MKEKYEIARQDNPKMKVWKSAKQPPTRNAKNQVLTESQQLREKMYLPVEKKACDELWETVRKAVLRAKKIAKYPGDTLVSLDVLLNGSGTKDDLAQVPYSFSLIIFFPFFA